MSFHCKTASDATDSGYGGFLQIPRTSIRNFANKILKNSSSLLGSHSSVTCTQFQQGGHKDLMSGVYLLPYNLASQALGVNFSVLERFLKYSDLSYPDVLSLSI